VLYTEIVAGIAERLSRGVGSSIGNIRFLIAGNGCNIFLG
jgi:hypothetical protein